MSNRIYINTVFWTSPVQLK